MHGELERDGAGYERRGESIEGREGGGREKHGCEEKGGPLEKGERNRKGEVKEESRRRGGRGRESMWSERSKEDE